MFYLFYAPADFSCVRTLSSRHLKNRGFPLFILKDEDIVFDEDCPKMTHEMEKVLARAVAENNRLKRH